MNELYFIRHDRKVVSFILQALGKELNFEDRILPDLDFFVEKIHI